MKLCIALLCLLAPGLAAAAWVERVEDGIMGTRITVELWADDPAQGQAAIEAVLAEMRRVD
jgi:thiamine biosynthesis lipoprotein